MPTIDRPVETTNPPKPRHVLRVLIVDDNDVDRELTRHWLAQMWPFERQLSVVHCRNGEEALDRMLTTRLSLVLLDWNMPNLNGGELLQRMRKYGIDLPVVVLSGVQRDEVTLDLESLAAAFLNKNDLDVLRLENAIARSILLKERLAALTASAAAAPTHATVPTAA